MDDASCAVDVAVLGDADVVRLQRRTDELERRLSTLESSLPLRIWRLASSASEKAVGRARRTHDAGGD